jgi:hypothetical protein
MTKHRVLVLCFSYFTDTSNIGQGLWKLRIAGKFVAKGECNGAIMDIFLSQCISIMHAMEFGLKLGAKSGGSKIIIIVLLEQVLI